MEFPRLMFRSPGANACQGGSYDHVSVENEDELIQRMEEGWYETLPEAVGSLGKPRPSVVAVPVMEPAVESAPAVLFAEKPPELEKVESTPKVSTLHIPKKKHGLD